MDDEDDTRLINDDTQPIQETNSTPVYDKLISWWNWIAYSQGHVYNDLCASMWFTYLMPYLQSCLQISAANAGLLMLVGQVADAIATPIIGLLSDKGSTAWYCSLGRRKTWHILGTLLVSLSFPFIFSPHLSFIPFKSQLEQVLYFCPFIIAFQFGWAAVQIAHLSLVPDLTPNEDERTSLLSVRYAFTVIANIVVYIIMYVAVTHSSTDKDPNLGPKDSAKFQFISYTVVLCGSFATIIFYCGVSEIRNRRLQLNIRNETSGGMYEEKKRTPWHIINLPSLYTVAVLYMTARLFFNVLQMFIVFYVTETLNLSKINIAIVPLVILLSGFFASLIVKPLNVKLGRKCSQLIGLGLGIIVSVIVFVGYGELYGKYFIYGVAVLYGMSSTLTQVTSFGIAADFVGDDVSNGAFIYGLLSFADKTSNGVIGFLIQKFNPEKGYYYRLALAYGCGVPCLVAVLALLFLPSSRKPNIPQSPENIEERTAAFCNENCEDVISEENSFHP